MSNSAKGLSTNGLIMPDDFPVAAYESVHRSVEPRATKFPEIYEQFGGAWNAVSYRFFAVAEYSAILSKSLAVRTSTRVAGRCEQERDLFGFFNSGFSVLESAFYGLFALGAFVVPAAFPINTPKDQQRISPSSTFDALRKTFAKEPIVTVTSTILSDTAYLEWREVRNILTHRAVPGRTVFLGIGGDDELPDQWKIKNIPLNAQMTELRRNELSRLITELLVGVDQFVKSHL